MQQTGIGKYIIVLLMFVFTVKMTIAQKFSPSSYIAEYKETAQQLMAETGVPASVILAIAIHESAYGNSRIAKHLNNHFGIKGKNNSRAINSAYKGYSSVRDSFLDFVGLLQRRKATNKLFEAHSAEDYKGWVKGIARSGYSTTGDWSSKVLATIQRYDLADYDDNPILKAELKQADFVKEDILLAEMSKNITKPTFDASSMLVVKPGESLSTITKRHKSSSNALKLKSRLSSSNLTTEQRLLL